MPLSINRYVLKFFLTFRLRCYLVIRAAVVVATDVYIGICGRGADVGDAQLNENDANVLKLRVCRFGRRMLGHGRSSLLLLETNVVLFYFK